MATKPVDSPHLCFLCEKKIRKNRESYRGPIPMEMLTAIRKDKREFHVKHDFCLECGKKYFDAVAGTVRKPAWMTRPLG